MKHTFRKTLKKPLLLFVVVCLFIYSTCCNKNRKSKKKRYNQKHNTKYRAHIELGFIFRLE